MAAWVGTAPFVLLSAFLGSESPWRLLTAWTALACAGLIANFSLGLAWHAYARRRKIVHPAIHVVAGAVLGACVGALLGLVVSWREPDAMSWNLATFSIVGLSYGALAAGAFWLIRRPDRDAPNPPTSAS